MNPLRLFFVPVLSAVLLSASAAVSLADTAKAPARIALSDQNNKARVINFPAKRVTVISMADRHGRPQSGQWEPTLAAWKKRADIHGIANAAGTPEFMKESIRKKIGAAHKTPLLIDWSGTTCTALGCKGNVANLVIVARDGSILHRIHGAPTAENVKAFNAALESAVAAKK